LLERLHVITNNHFLNHLCYSLSNKKLHNFNGAQQKNIAKILLNNGKNKKGCFYLVIFKV